MPQWSNLTSPATAKVMSGFLSCLMKGKWQGESPASRPDWFLSFRLSRRQVLLSGDCCGGISIHLGSLWSASYLWPGHWVCASFLTLFLLVVVSFFFMRLRLLSSAQCLIVVLIVNSFMLALEHSYLEKRAKCGGILIHLVNDFWAVNPRAWSSLPMAQFKGWGRGSQALSCPHTLLGGQSRAGDGGTVCSWCSSTLGRMPGQRQLDPWRHLIDSLSVSVCPYPIPK